MRETFTSGSTRGEWVAPLVRSPSLLLYRLSSIHNILNMLLPLYEPQSRANYAQLCATRYIARTAQCARWKSHPLAGGL